MLPLEYMDACGRNRKIWGENTWKSCRNFLQVSFIEPWGWKWRENEEIREGARNIASAFEIDNDSSEEQLWRIG